MVRLPATVILILSFVFLNSKLFAKNPPPGTGTSDIPANIMIMLDNSGSMQGRLPNKTGLLYPVDVQTDSSGNIFVLEYAYDRMKVFDSSGNFLRSFGSRGSSCKQWRHAQTICNL